jgi:Mannosyl-glycoprotein endo-beta-N-acetylglucosaminidase
MKKIIIVLFCSFLMPIFGFCQEENITENITELYINKYKQLAMHEQIRVGIPAAITLAQGIHESASGTSELATKANNHFGIKCKKDWSGETFLHDDDALQECFRKYTTDIASYEDHSNYLKNNRRYGFLFDIPLRNYVDWAVGLRKAGYATNPKYSSRLTELIKKFNLDKYTEEAIKKSELDVEQKAEQELKYDKQKIEAEQLEKTQKKLKQKELQQQQESETIVTQQTTATKITNEVDGFVREAKKIINNVDEEMQNGLRGFYAKKGDLLLKEAVARDIKYTKLLALNDLTEAPLPADMFIYLEKKFRKSPLKRIHIVAPGETMLTIAQQEAMQLYSLQDLNMMTENEEPEIGVKLFLQNTAIRKPALRKNIEVVLPVNQESKLIQKSEEINIANNVFTKEEIVQLKQDAETQAIEIVTPKVVNTTTTSAADIAASQLELANEVAANAANQKEVEIENTRQQQIVAEENSKLKKIGAEREAKQLAAKILAYNQVEAAAIKAVKAAAAEGPEAKVVKPKSPSTYKEIGVSEELHRIKKVMDEIVYAVPAAKKIKIITVPENVQSIKQTPIPKAKEKAVPIIPAKNPLKPTSKSTLPVSDKLIGPKQIEEKPATVKKDIVKIIATKKGLEKTKTKVVETKKIGGIKKEKVVIASTAKVQIPTTKKVQEKSKKDKK